MIEDLPERYHDYLERFERALPGTQVGGFGKFNGVLIKKLTFEEFTPAYLDYTELLTRYDESIERGDTIDDLVLRILRDKAADLVLPPPR